MNDIEQQLTTLTEWTGGATNLWQKAEPRKAGAVARLLPNLGRRLSNKLLVISGIAAVLMIAVFMNMPHLGVQSRDRARQSLKLAVPLSSSGAANSAIPTPGRLDSHAYQQQLNSIGMSTFSENKIAGLDVVAYSSVPNQPYFDTSADGVAPAEESVSAAKLRGIGQGMYIYAQDDPDVFPQDDSAAVGPPIDPWPIVRASGITPKQFICPSTSNVPDPATDTSSDYLPARRFVIQNGTVELLSSDVSAAFMKVQQLIRAEAGEFIENSSLSGDAQNAQANLTLRVTANRLDDVLNELRKIGRVESEQLGGRDVTTEVVDVDARLRNEKRVEVELLELLESRKDSPLTELMQLRDALKNVRYSIESLVGRRDALSRMVSLATLLVIIRTNVMPEAPAPDSYWSYFGREMNSAWTAAIRFLADALATILRILVGGLPFWIGLVVLYVILQKRKT